MERLHKGSDKPYNCPWHIALYLTDKAGSVPNISVCTLRTEDDLSTFCRLTSLGRVWWARKGTILSQKSIKCILNIDSTTRLTLDSSLTPSHFTLLSSLSKTSSPKTSLFNLLFPSQFRDLFCVPEPHVALHGVQSDQSENEPFSEGDYVILQAKHGILCERITRSNHSLVAQLGNLNNPGGGFSPVWGITYQRKPSQYTLRTPVLVHCKHRLHYWALGCYTPSLCNAPLWRSVKIIYELRILLSTDLNLLLKSS